MTRKLHNTLMAVIASSSLLVVGIIASSPVSPDFGAASPDGMLVSLDAQEELATSSIDQTQAVPTQKARAVRHRRQSLAMPFYSFAPRS